jgi:hypothetical protein
MYLTLIRLTPPGDAVRSPRNAPLPPQRQAPEEPAPKPSAADPPKPEPPAAQPPANGRPAAHRPTGPPHHPVTPETLVDILWACAIPEDGLEHLRARREDDQSPIDVAVFHRTDPAENPDQSLALCRRALQTAPPLKGWTAERLKTARTYPAG